jgi:HEAT repeat protein
MSCGRVRLFLSSIIVVLPGLLQAQSGDFLGRTADDWAKQLKDPQPGMRRSAAFALGQIGTLAQEYLPQLVEAATNDKAPTVRERAAMAMGSILLYLKEDAKDKWPQYGPALEQQLKKEPDVRVRRGLLYALGGFGPGAVPAVPSLLSALEDSNSGVRQNAAYALGRLGEAGDRNAVAELCKHLQDGNPMVRRDVVNALGDIGLPAAGTAMEPLLDLIEREGQKEGDAVVLKAALEKSIRLIGEPGYAITDKTLAAIRNAGVPEFVVAKLIALKDKEMDQEAFLRALSRTLTKNEFDDMRYFLVQKAGRYSNQKWAERLHPYLKNEDIETARAAAFALAKIGGPGSRPALPVLEEGLRDAEDPQLQEQAAAALAEIGPDAGAAVADLGKGLSSPVAVVRRNCAVALGRIGPASEAAVPQLIKALKPDSETEFEVRRYAAEALFFIGEPGNEKAIPAVVDIVRKDPDPRLRHACIDVLFKVRDFKQYGAEKVLNGVLDETDPNTQGLRYEAARVLAFHLREKCPEKAAALLLSMLKSSNLSLYKGAKTQVEGAGENRSNQTTIKDTSGGDARFLAAEALGWMGKKAKTDTIIAELEKAAKDTDPMLREHALHALESIRK